MQRTMERCNDNRKAQRTMEMRKEQCNDSKDNGEAKRTMQLVSTTRLHTGGEREEKEEGKKKNSNNDENDIGSIEFHPLPPPYRAFKFFSR